MSMFSFVNVWKIEAPIEAVWDALLDVERWPSWWKGVEEVHVVTPGDASKIGLHTSQVWKSELPYKLRFDATIAKVEPKTRIEIDAVGELSGKGLMRFADGGKVTTVQFDWNVSTTTAWMNFVAPVARPVFAWNHDVIMNWGAAALAQKLGGTKAETSEKPIF